jgi:hypothetical protein
MDRLEVYLIQKVVFGLDKLTEKGFFKGLFFVSPFIIFL